MTSIFMERSGHESMRRYREGGRSSARLLLITMRTIQGRSVVDKGVDEGLENMA